jgi:phage terminase large subunit-like protein
VSYSDVAKQYCEDIRDGVIPSGRLVQLSCKRHLTDLERQTDPAYPFKFLPKLAHKRCAFSEKFPHVKGKWTGQLITLQPHQVFMQCAIWGWVRKSDQKRRFRIVYIEEPRKNGKSTDAATAANYMLAADGEKGAEVYSGATTEKQALEVFRPAWQMAHKSDDFREFYGVSLSGTPKNPTAIYRLDDMSRCEPLVGNPGDGASPHCAIIDEYHEHRTSDQYDTMETGMGAREQPLMFVITTAGSDTSGPCYDMHLRAIKVLEGTIEDDAFFAIIYGIDPEDDYKDFAVWQKANPNYGVSIQEDYLKRKYTETMTNASKQNINLCKHLNVWTNAGVAWMNMVKWAACTDTGLRLVDFKGCPCWIGVDLASKIDLCALLVLFEIDPSYIQTRPAGSPLRTVWERAENQASARFFAAFGRYYLPEETVKLAGNDHYVKWVKEGHITQTPGARTDFLAIENDLKKLHADHPIQQVAYDPREATYLMNNVMDWIEPNKDEPEVVIEINQGPALISEPMKELEALIYSQRLWSDGDPVLAWMMGNVVKKQGRVGGPVKYYYPTKEKNENKIDGATALIMAVGRAMLRQGPQQSAYETPGAEILTF